MREALDHVDVGNHHLVSGWRARLGAAALRRAPADGFPTRCSRPRGTESVDLALRLARATTGRHEADRRAPGGYHGLSGFALAASDPRWFEPFGYGPPGFVHVPFNDHRCDCGEVD